jgi:hypothetical protein
MEEFKQSFLEIDYHFAKSTGTGEHLIQWLHHKM